MKTDGTSVAIRLEKINERVAAACARSGRRREDVRVLAVSKLQPVSKIREAFVAGQIYFAENYVQEAVDKLGQLADLPIEWHFIGRLQTNKIKMVAGHFAAIHSVDRLEVAQGLNARTSSRVQDIFLQYNVALEASKGGASEKEVMDLVERASQWPNLQVRGLMVMPPLFKNVEEARPFFKKARVLAEKLRLNELSMGTSADFAVAIEEGATWVRIGSEIFGERPSKDGVVQ